MSALLWYVDDLNPAIQQTIAVGGVAQDLSGKPVQFKMRAVGSATLKVDAAATFSTDGTDGKVYYAWQAGDLDTAGDYLVWWEVGSSVQAVSEAIITVREHGPTSGYLCELADVRAAMELADNDTTLDQAIQTAIGHASTQIAAHCQREFFPTNGASRDFVTHGLSIIDLSPYDCRTVSSVVAWPGSEQYAIGSDLYRLDPADRWGGSSLLRIAFNTLLRHPLFGDPVVRVTGDWGLAAVPDPAKRACIVTVRGWLRRDVSAFAQYGDDGRVLQPADLTSYALPRAALNLLVPVARQRAY